MTEKGLNLPTVSNKHPKFTGLKISTEQPKRALVATPLTFSTQNHIRQGLQPEFDFSHRAAPPTSVRASSYHLAKTFSAFSTIQPQTSTAKAPIDFFVTKRPINTPSNYLSHRLESKESARNFSSYGEVRPSKDKVYLEKFIFEGTSPKIHTVETSTAPISLARFDGRNNSIKRPQTMGFFDSKADFGFNSVEHTQFTNEALANDENQADRLGQGYIKSLKVESKQKASTKKLTAVSKPNRGTLNGTSMEKCFSDPKLFRIRKDVSSKYKSHFDIEQQDALIRKRNALGIEEIIRANAHRILVVADTVGSHLIYCFIDRATKSGTLSTRNQNLAFKAKIGELQKQMKLDTEYKHLTLWNGKSVFEISQVPKDQAILFLTKEIDFTRPERFLRFELVREFNDYIKCELNPVDKVPTLLALNTMNDLEVRAPDQHIDKILNIISQAQPGADEIEQINKEIEQTKGKDLLRLVDEFMAQYDDEQPENKSQSQHTKQAELSKSDLNLPNGEGEESPDLSEIKADNESNKLGESLKEAAEKSGEEKSDEDPKEKAIREYLETNNSLVKTRKLTDLDRIVKFYEQNMKRGKIDGEEEDEDKENGNLGVTKKSATISKIGQGEEGEPNSLDEKVESLNGEDGDDSKSNKQSKNEDEEKEESKQASDFDDDPERKNKAVLEEIAGELDKMLDTLKNPLKKKDYFERKREMEAALESSRNVSKEVEFDVLGKPGEQEENLEALKASEKKDFLDINKKRVANKRSDINNLNRFNRELFEKNIPKYMRELNLSRRELHFIWILYKALCEVTSQRYKYYNPDDGIDYYTFRNGIYQIFLQSEELAEKIFYTIDINYSGFLNWDEFLEAMVSIRAKTLKDKIDLFIKIADEDGNQHLSQEEIFNLCKICLGKFINTKEGTFLDELCQYFTKLIFETVGMGQDEEIPLQLIKQVILDGNEGSDLLSMFCGADM